MIYASYKVAALRRLDTVRYEEHIKMLKIVRESEQTIKKYNYYTNLIKLYNKKSEKKQKKILQNIYDSLPNDVIRIIHGFLTKPTIEYIQQLKNEHNKKEYLKLLNEVCEIKQKKYYSDGVKHYFYVSPCSLFQNMLEDLPNYILLNFISSKFAIDCFNAVKCSCEEFSTFYETCIKYECFNFEIRSLITIFHKKIINEGDLSLIPLVRRYIKSIIYISETLSNKTLV